MKVAIFYFFGLVSVFVVFLELDAGDDFFELSALLLPLFLLSALGFFSAEEDGLLFVVGLLSSRTGFGLLDFDTGVLTGTGDSSKIGAFPTNISSNLSFPSPYADITDG